MRPRRDDFAPGLREISVALVADRPPVSPPGVTWAYSNVGYVLVGLIVEAATGRTLGQELSGRIFDPLGLRDTSFPVNGRRIPSPHSRGYSLPLGPELAILDGPLVDITVQNPSYAWAAGAADLQPRGSRSRPAGAARVADCCHRICLPRC